MGIYYSLGIVQNNESGGFMKRKQKAVLVALMTLGVTFSGSTYAYDQDWIVEDGEIHSGNQTGEDGESNRIMVKNGSIWNGNVDNSHFDKKTVDMDIKITEKSGWNGNINSQDSTVNILIDDSMWTSTESGGANQFVSISEPMEINITLQNEAEWIGNIRVGALNHAGKNKTSVTVLNSTWEGNVRGQHSSGTVLLDQGSLWKGEYEGRGATLEENSGRIEILNGSKWVGDALMNDGSEDGEFLIRVSDESKWQGDIKVTDKDDESLLTTQIQITEQSGWEGNMILEGKSRVELDIASESTWVGDLDISKNKPVEDDTPDAVAGWVRLDGATWQGKLITTEGKPSIDMALSNDGRWRMTESSTLTKLEMNDGTVEFASPENEFLTLTVRGNLYGGEGNLFMMNADIESEQGDLLKIQGTVEGEFNRIQVKNQGSSQVDPETKLTIIETGGSMENSFVMANAVEVGGFEYGLKKVGNDWSLQSIERATSSASASANAFAGAYLLNYSETQSLMQRLGDLEVYSGNQGIWARVFGGKISAGGSNFLRGFDMNYSGTQVGYDSKIYSNEEIGDIYVGGMFGYNKGSLRHSTGHGSVDSKTVAIYSTYKNPKGFYLDGVLKYGWMANNFKVLDTAGEEVRGEGMNTHGWTASVEMGQRIHLTNQKEGWYLEPQAQLSMAHHGGGTIKASNGLTAEVDGFRSTLGRVGLQAGYEVKSGKNPLNVYGKASYVKEFKGDVGMSFNGVAAEESFADSWWTYGVGVSAKVKNNQQVYLEVERASGGKFDQPWGVSGGYRITW